MVVGSAHDGALAGSARATNSSLASVLEADADARHLLLAPRLAAVLGQVDIRTDDLGMGDSVFCAFPWTARRCVRHVHELLYWQQLYLIIKQILNKAIPLRCGSYYILMNMKPQLYIEQKITAFVNKYKILGVTETGEPAGLIAMAQQKRLAFKEKVTFYSDESQNQLAFTFRAEKVMDIHGRYFVEDMNGQLGGMFRKLFGQSLAVSTWRLMDVSGNDIFEIKESNVTLAVLRRFGGWIPIVGDVIELVTLFLKYHFVVVDLNTNQIVGKYEKTTLFRDHYKFSMTDEAYAKLPWQAFAAMGVGLDALQSR